MQTIEHVKPRFFPSCSVSQVNTLKHFSYFRDDRVRVESFEELRNKTILIHNYDIAWHKVKQYIHTLEALLHTEVYFAMPRNSSTPLPNWQFAVISLTNADEEKFTEWYTNNFSQLIELLSECLSEGYKLSLTYDTENVCYIATFSGTVNSVANKNVSMSARSDDLLEALGLLLFKHIVMCERGEWLKHTRRSNWG